MQTVSTVSVVFTQEQFERFQQMWSAARESELAIAALWNHDSVENIEAAYQLPADSLLDDMAEHFASLAIGFSLV
jgi:hypothetical protein